jgi:hypothetical protein
MFLYFSLSKTGSGAHPASYLIGTGVKRLEREDGHSPPSNAEVKNGGTPTLPCLHGVVPN